MLLNTFVKNISFLIFIILTMTIYSLSLINVYAQSEITAWGNIEGIRYKGEAIKFESSIRVVKADWSEIVKTAKEKQRPSFRRIEKMAVIKTKLENISIEEKILDVNSGDVDIDINLKAESDIAMQGAYFCIELPNSEFKDVGIKYIEKKVTPEKTESPEDMQQRSRWRPRIISVLAKGVTINSDHRYMEISFPEFTEIIVREGNPYRGNPNTEIYFTLMKGNVVTGYEEKKTIKINVSGTVDKGVINLSINTNSPGRRYDGIGGNFRLQYEQDEEVIDYCLNNLNVRWGRVEMPWRFWHRDEDVDPYQQAKNGNISERVESAMKMARRLSKLDMPVILSCWSTPSWAIIGERKYGPGDDGLYGNALNKSKMSSIIKSITSYILYMKNEFGVEPVMFSFNESDLGIYVRQTGDEHAEFIKSLGSYMASQGLSTKMLLGDNSDATTYEFVTPAMNDIETHKYIGAVSFHSWRGTDNWTLGLWGDIAKKMNVPLLVGEGSIDAAAHRYPDIFLEPTYALNEIDTYIRIFSVCKASSILQWQLTADYSVLTGNGIYYTKGKLRPTQRFWNLKQLDLTPPGSFNLPINSNKSDVSCAAFGDIKNGLYTIHMVNNGSKRPVALKGLPNKVKKIDMYVTNSLLGMKYVKEISVVEGVAKFIAVSASYITLRYK